MADHLPASAQIEQAQARRRTRRRGVSRLRIVGAAFAVAVFLGIISGCLAPGA